MTAEEPDKSRTNLGLLGELDVIGDRRRGGRQGLGLGELGRRNPGRNLLHGGGMESTCGHGGIMIIPVISVSLEGPNPFVWRDRAADPPGRAPPQPAPRGETADASVPSLEHADPRVASAGVRPCFPLLSEDRTSSRREFPVCATLSASAELGNDSTLPHTSLLRTLRMQVR
jgi:hypothetical protein